MLNTDYCRKIENSVLVSIGYQIKYNLKYSLDFLLNITWFAIKESLDESITYCAVAPEEFFPATFIWTVLQHNNIAFLLLHIIEMHVMVVFFSYWSLYKFVVYFI